MGDSRSRNVEKRDNSPAAKLRRLVRQAYHGWRQRQASRTSGTGQPGSLEVLSTIPLPLPRLLRARVMAEAQHRFSQLSCNRLPQEVCALRPGDSQSIELPGDDQKLLGWIAPQMTPQGQSQLQLYVPGGLWLRQNWLLAAFGDQRIRWEAPAGFMFGEGPRRQVVETLTIKTFYSSGPWGWMNSIENEKAGRTYTRLLISPALLQEPLTAAVRLWNDYATLTPRKPGDGPQATAGAATRSLNKWVRESGLHVTCLDVLRWVWEAEAWVEAQGDRIPAVPAERTYSAQALLLQLWEMTFSLSQPDRYVERGTAYGVPLARFRKETADWLSRECQERCIDIAADREVQAYRRGFDERLVCWEQMARRKVTGSWQDAWWGHPEPLPLQ